MINSPAISVVIPTFNRADLVRLAINSVLAQTHPAAEVLVVDDGSKEDMREVLSRYASPVSILRQPNSGLSGARNTGIRAASHDWIAFLDDDDEHTPDRLERAAESIRRFPQADVHAINTTIITSTGVEVDLFGCRGMPVEEWMCVDRPLSWVLKGCFFAQSMVVRKSALEEVGLFRTTFYEDMDMFVRLSSRRPWIVDGKPGLRLIRRNNTDAMSDDWRSRPLERCDALVRIHREALARPDLSEKEVAMARNGLATYLYELGVVKIRNGDSTSAEQHFAEAGGLFQTSKGRMKARAARWGGRPMVRLLERLARRRKGIVR